MEAQTSSLISLLEPVYGLILSYLILKEQPSLRTRRGLPDFSLGSLVVLS